MGNTTDRFAKSDFESLTRMLMAKRAADPGNPPLFIETLASRCAHSDTVDLAGVREIADGVFDDVRMSPLVVSECHELEVHVQQVLSGDVAMAVRYLCDDDPGVSVLARWLLQTLDPNNEAL